MDPTIKAELLASIAADRLVLIVGAGLSMDPPSNAPSANALLSKCIKEYSYHTGGDVPAQAQTSLESLADFFLSQGTFSSLFINKMLRNIREFYQFPNQGHYTVSDFLGCHVIEYCVSANLDVLIEEAAVAQGDVSFFPALDGEEASVTIGHRPLLKIHGCFRRSPDNTLWTHSQLTSNLILAERINTSSAWLTGLLMQKSVVFIGFWSDWSYLNDVISRALSASTPSRVYVIDPIDLAQLSIKAPDLWSWANGHNLQHVQESGSEFLDELRIAYSQNFIDRLFLDAADTYEENFGSPPTVAASGLGAMSSDDLYNIRKNLCGVPHNEVVRKKYPDEGMYHVGSLLLKAIELGGTTDGHVVNVKGKRIRIVNGAGQNLSKVMDRHSHEVFSPLDQVDMVLCTAFDDGGVPRNLVRPGRGTGVVRPASPEPWVSLNKSLDFLR